MSSQTLHTGTVVAVCGDRAVIRFSRSPMCKHCGACFAAGETEMETSVENTLRAEVGERVAVELPPRRLLKASVLAYALPLAALLLGLLLGSSWGEVPAIVLGLCCCALAYVLLRILDRKFSRARTFEPRMLQRVNSTEEE